MATASSIARSALCAFTVVAGACGDVGEEPKPKPRGEGAAASSRSRADLDLPPIDGAPHPIVRLVTSEGPITLELNRRKAPATVANFLDYARRGFYDGTIFHRVLGPSQGQPQRIQGGTQTAAGVAKAAGKPILSEANNGLRNARGTIAAQRAAEPHTATSGFFINVTDNPSLDHQSEASGRTYGYCVFGKVKDDESLAVVDRVAAAPVTADAASGGELSRPRSPVRIEKVVIVNE